MLLAVWYTGNLICYFDLGYFDEEECNGRDFSDRKGMRNQIWYAMINLVDIKEYRLEEMALLAMDWQI